MLMLQKNLKQSADGGGPSHIEKGNGEQRILQRKEPLVFERKRDHQLYQAVGTREDKDAYI